MSGPSRADTVDAIAAAVRAVPGVADLHPGALGEVGTYLPGRRVAGIRVASDVTEVHVALTFGSPVRETAAAVRAVVAPLVSGPVDVTVEDVVPEELPPPPPTAAPDPIAAGSTPPPLDPV